MHVADMSVGMRGADGIVVAVEAHDDDLRTLARAGLEGSGA